MRLEIHKEEDRMTVAAILVKNGYRVFQTKQRKTPTGKTMIYVLDVKKVEEDQGSRT